MELDFVRVNDNPPVLVPFKRREIDRLRSTQVIDRIRSDDISSNNITVAAIRLEDNPAFQRTNDNPVILKAS